MNIRFKFWNSQPGVIHHRQLDGQERHIRAALHSYPLEMIRLAIARYSQVMVNAERKYREVYSWTLGEFLSRKGHKNLKRFTCDCWEKPFLSFEAGDGPRSSKRLLRPSA